MPKSILKVVGGGLIFVLGYIATWRDLRRVREVTLPFEKKPVLIPPLLRRG